MRRWCRRCASPLDDEGVCPSCSTLEERRAEAAAYERSIVEFVQARTAREFEPTITGALAALLADLVPADGGRALWVHLGAEGKVEIDQVPGVRKLVALPARIAVALASYVTGLAEMGPAYLTLVGLEYQVERTPDGYRVCRA